MLNVSEQSPESDEDEEKRDESSEDEMPRQKFWKKGVCSI
jgi:hypothetical protein